MAKASSVVLLLVGMLLVASAAAASGPDVNEEDLPSEGLPYEDLSSEDHPCNVDVDAEESSVAGPPKPKDCCKLCKCTRSVTPQCWCTDVGTSCYRGCKKCLCTRSIPPQCRCSDMMPICPKKCPSTGVVDVL